MPEYPIAPDPLSGFPYSNVVVSGDLVAIASQTPFDDSQHLVGPGLPSKPIRYLPTFAGASRPRAATWST